MQRSVALDLLPLLKPFKRSGRLALRIERLPQRAKLSAGRRNSDGSWSLASDELEELNYLIPSNIAAAHELTVRVMKFDDGAASTLKVIQYPIAAWEETAEPASDEDAICRSTEPDDPILHSQLGEMQSLFAVRESELTELRGALERVKEEKAAELAKARAAWDQELSQRLAEVAAQVQTQVQAQAQAQSDKKRDRAEQDGQLLVQAEARAQQKLALEREQWRAETERRLETERQKLRAEADQRLAAELERFMAQAERRIEAERRAWQAESEQRGATDVDRHKAQVGQHIEAERRKWQAEADARLTVERERFKAQTEQHIESERRKWQAESSQRLTAELEQLKTQMEQRAEAERQSWQAQGDARITADRDRWNALADQRIEAERQAWQAQADQRAAAELERLKAQMQQRIETERQTWQAQGDQSAAEIERQKALADHRIEAERRAWQAEADQRAAADQLRRQAELEQRETERRTWQAETEQRLEAERQAWRSETEQRAEAERKAWRGETEQRLEAERRRWDAESLIAQGKAEERRNAQEAERSAAARAEWQQQSARMLSQEADKARRLEAILAAEADKGRKLEAALEALVQARNVPTLGNETQELDRLRNELVQTQVTLAERDSELVRRRMEVEQERERAQQDAESYFEATAKALKNEESARLDAALAKARVQSEEALAEMALRCEQAEHALTEARRELPASAPRDDNYVEDLRAEVLELRKVLADREVELGWARAALDESRPLHVRSAGENLPITNFQGPAEEQEETESNAGTRRTLVRDCLLVIGLVVPLILLYPWIAAYLPDNVQSGIASMTGGLLSAGSERPAPVTHAAPARVVQLVQRPTAMVIKSVKVRATPAVKGTVVVTLQKSASVVVLEQQGNWTHIEVPAKDATSKSQQGWVYSSYLDAADPNVAKPTAAKPTAAKPTAASPAAANPTPARPNAVKPDAVKLNAPTLNAANPNATDLTTAGPTAASPAAANPIAADPNAADPNAAK